MRDREKEEKNSQEGEQKDIEREKAMLGRGGGRSSLGAKRRKSSIRGEGRTRDRNWRLILTSAFEIHRKSPKKVGRTGRTP